MATSQAMSIAYKSRPMQFDMIEVACALGAVVSIIVAGAVLLFAVFGI